MNNGKKAHAGFSIVELLVVLAIVATMVTFAILAMSSRRLHYIDNQAYIVLDFLKEARQRAISQKEIMRVEINRDDGVIRLLNENDRGTANDDEVVRTHQFQSSKRINYDRAPENMASPPDAVTPVPVLEYKASTHPTSVPHNVGVVRFLPNGNITNAGSDAVGANATTTGVTLYFWSPTRLENGDFSNDAEVLRAITVLGTSGNASFHMCPIENGDCTTWR